MVKLKDYLSDQDKQNLGKLSAQTVSKVPDNTIVTPRSDSVLVIRRRSIKQNIPIPHKASITPHTKLIQKNSLHQDYLPFYNELCNGKEANIDSNMLYDFFYEHAIAINKQNFFPTKEFHHEYIPIYKIIVEDKRFKDLLDKHYYSIFKTINKFKSESNEYSKILSTLIDIYACDIYIKAHNDNWDAIIRQIEKKYTQRLFDELLQRQENDFIHELLKTQFSNIFNSCYNLSEQKEKVILENCCDTYDATYHRQKYKTTAQYIEDNIYKLFTRMNDLNLQIPLKEITYHFWLGNSLRKNLIQHGFDKYTESFFQLKTNQILRELRPNKPTKEQQKTTVQNYNTNNIEQQIYTNMVQKIHDDKSHQFEVGG